MITSFSGSPSHTRRANRRLWRARVDSRWRRGKESASDACPVAEAPDVEAGVNRIAELHDLVQQRAGGIAAGSAPTLQRTPDRRPATLDPDARSQRKMASRSRADGHP